MSSAIKKIVIVGGGSAGWLTAGVIAAEHQAHTREGIQVTLVESPDVKPIGVGEGTWPTMRNTLRKMGISETDLFRKCEASFKQGAKFSKWVTGEEDDFYYHPLVIPNGYSQTDLASQWGEHYSDTPYAEAFNYQAALCENGLAPKQITTPEYAAVANYAYHLNSGKLGEFLQKHCTQKLGVMHVLDNVSKVISDECGDIESVVTESNGHIYGDLFIDCSGFKSLLIGQHYRIPFVKKQHILFNDTALAAHVPYMHDDSPIASHTISTAQSAGWIWDIGLPSRRGVGSVYSSAHISQEHAEKELHNYIAQTTTEQIANSLSFRKIDMNPGHREKFWHKNCVAVGMAAGFLEPLEASALVLVELSAAMISDELPASKETMQITAKRFNERFNYRWERIIEFLKLHYVLTKRTDSNYWVDNCRSESIPQSLQSLLTLWKYQPPSRHDFPQVEEIFASASWQYVLYGMGYKTLARPTAKRFSNSDIAKSLVLENKKIIDKYIGLLPNNRELINKIKEFGLQKI